LPDVIGEHDAPESVGNYACAMRTAMRVLFLLALPGIVFGWLTRVPQLRFKPKDFDFFAPDVGWSDVLAAVLFAPQR
jgi:uncharacterized membrane protein YpjA